MDAEQFEKLRAQCYNRIPVTREVLADLDTPLSTYLKLAEGPYSYLFESVQGGEKWGRYSIIGLPSRTQLKVCGHQVSVTTDGVVVDEQQVEDPLAFIEAFQAEFKVPELDGLPRFTGGLVGYFGYDTIRYVEAKLAHSDKDDPLGTPDIVLMVSDEVVVFDNLGGKLHIIVQADPGIADAYAQAEARLDELAERLRREIPAHAHPRSVRVKESDFVSGFTQEGFEAAVAKCKEYIVEGDVMQVVLSQRMSIPLQSRPLDLYRALRSLNPSPYMYYLDMGDFDIVGSSPEILTRLEDGVVTVRPIAGTRPRGGNEAEDVALEDGSARRSEGVG